MKYEHFFVQESQVLSNNLPRNGQIFFIIFYLPSRILLPIKIDSSVYRPY